LLILNLLNKFALASESLCLNFGDNGGWFLFLSLLTGMLFKLVMPHLHYMLELDIFNCCYNEYWLMFPLNWQKLFDSMLIPLLCTFS
jgi:hypothetical protein